MSSDPEQVGVQLALAELTKPTTAITQQFLDVHSVLSEDGTPSVADVIATEDGFDVYFNVQDESYYLVFIVLRDGERLFVNGCRAQAACKVYLKITSDTLRASDITERTGLTPTKSWDKDDPRQYGPITYDFTGWFFDPFGYAPGEFEEKLTHLLDVTEHAAPRIRAVAGECYVAVAAAYFGYKDQMWGVSFGPRDAQRLAALGASFDVDLYASGPHLPSE